MPQLSTPSSRREANATTWTDWLDQNASKGVRRYVPSSVNDVVHAVKNERKLRTIGPATPTTASDGLTTAPR